MSSRLESAWNEGKGRVLRLTLALDSRVSSADIAESKILEFCGRAQYPQMEAEEAGLAVRESVANAVLHGNREDLSKKVLLTAEINDVGLVICIQDEGEGFDPNSLADPLVPDNLLNETGRGLFLVKTCMDEVVLRRMESRGMEIKMVKHVSKTSLRRSPK